MNLKLYQSFTLSNLCCLYKKFWTQTTIQPSIWLQILSNPSQLYDSSSEMYRFVSTYVTKVCETSSTFSHNLHIWYYDILPNLIIFRLCLLFLNFFKKFKNWLFGECPSLQTPLCRVPTPRHSANNLVCRVPFFGECFFVGTWQINCLSCARKITLGKPLDTRRTTVFS